MLAHIQDLIFPITLPTYIKIKIYFDHITDILYHSAIKTTLITLTSATKLQIYTRDTRPCAILIPHGVQFGGLCGFPVIKIKGSMVSLVYICVQNLNLFKCITI